MPFYFNLLNPTREEKLQSRKNLKLDDDPDNDRDAAITTVVH